MGVTVTEDEIQTAANVVKGGTWHKRAGIKFSPRNHSFIADANTPKRPGKTRWERQHGVKANYLQNRAARAERNRTGK